MLSLQLSLTIHTSTNNLSSSNFCYGATRLFLAPKFSLPTLSTPHKHTKSTIICMGGGPRTFPGGVSKWQWKRMQAKKAKQLLKARLARERQIYEMRKRAELKAAVSELERPWEVVEKAPTLFSTSADEQVKVLADRFQKPGGLDLWSEKDGPQLFETVDGVASARFFPKGVVHSIKPYGRLHDGGGEICSSPDPGLDSHSTRLLENGSGVRNRYKSIGDNLGGNDGLNASGSGRVLENGDGYEKMRAGRHGYRKIDGNFNGDDGLRNSVSNGRQLSGRGRNRHRRTRDGSSDNDDDLGELDSGLGLERGNIGKMGMKVNVYSKNSRKLRGGYVRVDDDKRLVNGIDNEDSYNGKFIKKGTGRRSDLWGPRKDGFNQEEGGRNRANRSVGGRLGRRRGSQELKGLNSEVFDLNMQGPRKDGFNREEGGRNRANHSGGGRLGRQRGFQELKGLNSEVFDLNMQHDGSYVLNR